METRAPRPAQSTKPQRPAWIRAYTWRLLLSDSIAIVVAVTTSQLAWFGTARDSVSGTGIPYLAVSAVLTLAWLATLRVCATRDPRIVGSGLGEYARTAEATLRYFGLIAIAALLLGLDLARGYLFVAFPLGLFLILLGRWLWRQWLRRERYRGRYVVRMLLVGSVEAVATLASELTRHAYAGYRVVGFCLTDSADPRQLERFAVPLTSGPATVLDAVQAVDAHAVALAGSDGLPPRTVRSIGWQLEKTAIDLLLVPSMTDIAGTRIHTRPVAGVPLIYVESPRYEGAAKAVKALFDFSSSLLLVILLSPVFIALAIGVRASSPGPVFYRQERVGRNGKRFSIIKFRSMSQGADAELMGMLREQQQAHEPLFKVRDDPRVTRFGRFLRVTSLDELPQIFNVLRGEMSLVGPRPQVPAEVALYDNAAQRRLLVKPGITGLWQISGRSDLSWEESVRLDLYYVENWSLTDDLIIMLRTVRAVLSRNGAR